MTMLPPTPLMACAPSHLLYLHGFRSSPRSMKAQRVGAWLAAHHPDTTFWCPQLPPSPRDAMALILHGTAHWPVDRMAVLGSSLGGFYATVFAETRGCAAVVMNPVVHAARDLARHMGQQTQWQTPDDSYYDSPEFIEELRVLNPGPLRDPSRYAAIMATGDEVLDWREMKERYAGARQWVIEGSDHAISEFDDALRFLLQALALWPATPPTPELG